MQKSKVVFNYSSDYDKDGFTAYMTISEVEETTGMKLSSAAVNTIIGVGCIIRCSDLPDFRYFLI